MNLCRSHLKTMPKSGADSFLGWQGAMDAGIADYFKNMVTQPARKNARLTKWQRFEMASGAGLPDTASRGLEMGRCVPASPWPPTLLLKGSQHVD